MTQTAHEFLADRQAQFPPDRPGDRAKTLLGYLEGRLPTEIVELFHGGEIACAEIGIHKPNAITKTLANNCYAIEMWTGIERFFYRVARALCTRARIFSGKKGTPPVEPTLAPEETVSLLREIFDNFRRLGLSRGPSASSYPITMGQKELASGLTDNAEIFVFAHEIGHAVTNRKRGTGAVADPATQSSNQAVSLLSQAEEVMADSLALEYVLGAHRSVTEVPKRSVRMAYAGAEFAVRVLKCLEYVGFQFEESHPLPSTRLELLRKHARQLCSNDLQFRELTTIAFAFDELLESVEGGLKPSTQERNLVSQSPERYVTKLAVILEEGVKGMFKEEEVLSSIVRLFNDLPPQKLHDTAKRCSEVFGQSGRNQHESEMEMLKGGLFQRLVPLLPEHLKTEFSKK